MGRLYTRFQFKLSFKLVTNVICNNSLNMGIHNLMRELRKGARGTLSLETLKKEFEKSVF